MNTYEYVFVTHILLLVTQHYLNILTCTNLFIIYTYNSRIIFIMPIQWMKSGVFGDNADKYNT